MRKLHAACGSLISLWLTMGMAHATVPQHPYMAPNGRSNIHVDSYMSDAHEGVGPTSPSAKVSYYKYGATVGECAAFAFDSKGRIVTVCVKLDRTELLVVDPVSLELVANYRLPARESTWQSIIHGDFDNIMNDTSGGSYFYLDHLDRAVVVSSDRRIRVIGQDESGRKLRLRLEEEYDLNPHVPSDCVFTKRPGWKPSDCDRVTTVLPDWNGLLWYVTRQGRIGTVDPLTGRTQQIRFNGEELQNSFAIAEDGVYILSDYALYRMKADVSGAPTVIWRETYDRGTRKKPGMINQGSGTTPTLLGDHFVAIADNADPRTNVIVYRRDRDRADLICQQPVFAPGRSTTENSLIGYEHSLIIENNYGYNGPFKKNDLQAGVARVDFNPILRKCSLVWESNVLSPTTVAKLAIGNGTLYFYSPDQDQWSLTGVDFNTGKTLFRIPTGRGSKYNNNWASITLTPEGDAVVGMLQGFLSIRDAR